MRRGIGLAVVAALAALFCSGGCGRQTEKPPEDELSAEALEQRPGLIRVRLVGKPDALPVDAKEATYEWAVLALLSADRLGGLTGEQRGRAEGKVGWVVIRYRLTVKVVGDNEAETVPENE